MNAFPFTAFDLLVGVVLLISVVAALSRGFVRELLSLASWVGALAAAWYLFAPVRPLVYDAVRNDLLADLATAAGVFLVPYVLLRLLTGSVARRVSESAFAGADRMLAFVYGALRGAFVVSAGWLVATIVLDEAPMPRWVAKAWSAPYVGEGARALGRLLPDGFLDDARGTARKVGGDAARAVGGYPEEANRALETLVRSTR